MTTLTSPTQIGILATKIASEAITLARELLDATKESTPVSVARAPQLYASLGGTWQIHSTSKLLTIDASVTLTAEATATVDTLAIALVRSFWTTALQKVPS